MARIPEVVVAMDWGGTWARASVASRNGELLWNTRLPNVVGGSKEQLLEDAETVLRQAIDWCGDRQIGGIGVAAAGPIDTETGTFYAPPNLAVLDGVSLKMVWEAKLGYPVFIGNDANLAALGELKFGAGAEAQRHGRSARALVYVTVSTGVGGGVIDRGRMLLGANGMAGEVGHMVIDSGDAAPRCQCGNTGCLEALASGTSIARTARAKLNDASFLPSLLVGQDIESITAETVFAAAAQGDRLAQSVLDGVVRALSVGLTNLLHLFNPDIIVLGGGVTRGLTEAGLVDRIKDGILQRAMSQRHREFSLVPSRLGDSVGMIGAASLAWQELGPA
jgi:glucokinase